MRAPRVLLVISLAAGCAPAAAPYRFGSPLISGARAELETPGPAPATPRRRRAAPRRIPAPAAVVAADRANARAAAAHVATADPLPPEELPPQVDRARLPAPHQALPRALPDVATPGDLRAMTGARTGHHPHAFAVIAATALVGRDGPDGIPTDGERLLAWASDHAAAIAPGDAAPGDLLAFDRTDGDAPASLWAVVIGRDARGVVEMLYVAGGVVRRGFVDPAQPRVGRGPDRAIHNTFLRHSTHWPPPGTRFLAGELLGHAFRLR